MNCGVLEWVDAPWPATIMQTAILKVWYLYHDDNHARMMDKKQHIKEVAKLKKEISKLTTEAQKMGDQYQNLVDEVTKMFDWQDGNNEFKCNKEAGHEATNVVEDKDISMEIEKGMEKMNIEFKYLKNISISQSQIIRNTRKERDQILEDLVEVKEERDGILQQRDCLKEEKEKLELGIADLLTAGQCNKEKLVKIKAIIEE